MPLIFALRTFAPVGTVATDYDIQLLATYAALLDADRAGLTWQAAAERHLGLDPEDGGSQPCWASHLDRARWSVGDGLGAMIEASASLANR